MNPTPEKVLRDTLGQFLSAPSREEMYRLLTEHPEALAERSEAILAEWTTLARKEDNEEIARFIEKRRSLLRRCREAGIATAFREQFGPAAPAGGRGRELRQLLQQARQLGQPSKMPEFLRLVQRALALVSRTDHAELWASLQAELGNGFAQSFPGDRAANLEAAIAAYRAALEVYTREAFPVEWAKAQNNLGNAYLERIAGERSTNVEAAIAAYRAALEVYTRKAFPADWALTLHNLGNAWSERIAGERSVNLLAAIAAYQAALTVRTREASPSDWAMTLTNLGAAFRDLTSGDLSANVEAAIAAYRAALEVHTRDAFPVEWAGIQNNLGVVYRDRVAGDSSANREASIAAYRAALEVYTRDAFPARWAATQHNLGLAWAARLAGKRSANLEASIAAYRAALEVYTRDAFPDDWVMTQNNLGAAYLERVVGDRAENRQQAAGCWQAVLEYLQAACLDAGDGPLVAREVVAATRRLALLYQEDGRGRDVVGVLEEGKALGLRQELTRGDRTPAGLSAEEQSEYRSLVRAVREARSELRNLDKRGLPPAEYGGRLDELARRLDGANRRLHALEACDPNFGFRPPSYADLCRAARRHDLTIVSFHSSDEASLATAAYLIPGNSLAEEPPPVVVHLPELSRSALRDLLFAAPEGVAVSLDHWEELAAAGYAGALGWMTAYRLMGLARHAGDNDQQREAREVWQATMRSVLGELGRRLAEPLAARLEALGARQVVLLPNSLLALFPLHAAPLPGSADGRQYLGDRFILSSAPSAASLLRCLRLAEEHRRHPRPSLAALASPDGSLPFSDVEVDTIAARLAGNARVAHGSKASLGWLADNAPAADFLELSTHAHYRPGRPADSSLLLAHRQGRTWPWWQYEGRTLAALQAGCERLTLDDLWAGRLALKRGCVVCATACETGQVEPAAADEEHFGFPAAFLSLGASAAIASLWAVDDLSTAWLMELVYERMLSPQRLRPAEALQKACQALRGLRREDVLSQVRGMMDRLEQEQRCGAWEALGEEEFGARHYQLRRLQQRWYDLQQGPDRPYEDPHWWAAFIVHGA
jgi:CHAT domain-containing protein